MPTIGVDVDFHVETLTGMLLVTILASQLATAAQKCFKCLFGQDGCTRTVTYGLTVDGQLLDFMTKQISSTSAEPDAHAMSCI